MTNRTFEMIETNGVTLRTVVEGTGPLVDLAHTMQSQYCT